MIGAFACDFITRHRDRPFFLYYPMTVTHGPYQPTPDSADWDPAAWSSESKQGNHFGDMVVYMDKLVGRLVAHLEELGLGENTLILFLGDNGTGGGVSSRRNGRPVGAGKGETTDNGIHVPWIISWPAVIKSGQVRADLVDTTDILPTLCEAAGVSVPAGLPLDGRSVLPAVCGQPYRSREWVYCWYRRDGGPTPDFELAFDHRYKLYANGRFYHWREDLAERHPLDATKLTDQAAAARQRLQTALDKYREARPASLRKPTPGKSKENG